MIELYIDDRIRNRKVRFFDKFNISLRYDAVGSTFSFNCYFDPKDTEQREFLCVSHYHVARLVYDGKLFFTGYMVSQGFGSEPTKQWATVGGYSLPGVLEDCTIPKSLYPLQYNGLTLREIAAKLIKPFGLGMVVDGVEAEMDKKYPETEASATQKIKDYLTTLATQRNIVITHNANGNIVFTRAKTNVKPVIIYGGSDGIPCPKMKMSFSGQGMHSEITVVKEADKDGGNAGEFTISNPYVFTVFRPVTIQQSSGDDNDTEQAAKNALAAELKGLKLTVDLDRWAIEKIILQPNRVIQVTNPDIYLFKKTTWFIEQIDFNGDAQSETGTMTCVPVEVYSGEYPKYMFKGFNLH